MALRQSREAVDLFAALPEVGKVNPARYHEALRRRLQPINDVGTQQTSFAMEQSALRDAQRRQAMLSRLQDSQAAQIAQYANGAGVSPVVNGKWYHPLGTSMAPTFGFGAAYSNPALIKSIGPTHRGVDFSVKSGTPVYAPYSGTLKSFGMENSGFGNALRLSLSGGLLGILGHLSQFAPGLKPGMQISPGMLLGYSGRTGNTTGDHLHMELRDKYGRPINPNSYYGW